MPNNTTLTVDGRALKVSNLDKIFYQNSGFTKGQVLDYYIRAAPIMLEHIAKRPITLKRYPNGAKGKFFYQKECPASRPRWLQTTPIWSQGNKKNTNYCLIDTLPSLIWAANLAALELHTSLSEVPNIHCPTMIVFDLDPGFPASILECAEVALLLKEHLDAFNLQSFVKTSGSKGLQLYVPLNTQATYDQTKLFAKTLASLLEKEQPKLVISKMTKKLRTGKIFIDWSQNDEHKTTVCAYSLRAKEVPSVSTPITWAEVISAYQNKDASELYFSPSEVLDRIDRLGDLFEPVLRLKQNMPSNFTIK
ncbi:MAG: non-homologous end-joining DNA ligase [Pelosinus sp.]|nr:non-homologous end-joining DNA ligase [Pelosinus sp.]